MTRKGKSIENPKYKDYIECVESFNNPDEKFTCKQHMCFNQGKKVHVDPEGFCVEECPEVTNPINITTYNERKNETTVV